MCRWLAYSGTPIRLEELLLKRDRSLIDQSLHSRLGATTTNGDGFGVGWYEEGEPPRVYRSVHPAWNDRNLRELAAGISSPLFLAHIRASTGTAIQETNTHPFRFGNWLWMHNGAIRELPPGSARARARGRRVALPFDRGHDRLGGHVLPRTHLRARGRSLPRGGAHGRLRRGDRSPPRGRAPDPDDRRHSDGRTIWAFRYSSEGDSRSLYFSTRMDSLRRSTRSSRS